jgi:asparagine synthase (glutamine-hydrolysing)
VCGIVGHVVPAGGQLDSRAVRTALQRLAHRGPNDSGLKQTDTACLGHRRLSIIDLAGSPQPWSSEDGRYTIVFNGEIYNYLELRAELESAGFHFRTRGDTEVLLAMYIHHGEHCLGKLNGMFAFAVWDNIERRLFVARDRVGKKPLFYALFDGGIAFASEIEPLLAFTGIGRELDTTAIHDFFAYQYIPTPRTIYRAIRKLSAAHFLRYQEGQLEIARYWAPPLPTAQTTAPAMLQDELRSLLEDAVKLRLRSDVPLGAFLSGGLDSSIIVGLMTRLGFGVDSFHVGFDDASYDESAHARTAAQHFATRHHSLTLPLDQLAVLDATLLHFGEPFADPSAIPTWHLCRYTRQAVTVALSGDGADELFAGYRRYYARRFVSHYLRFPHRLREVISALVLRRLPEHDGYYANNPAKKLRLFVQLAERIAVAPNDLLAQTFSADERRALLTDEITVHSNDQLSDLNLGRLDEVSRMILADILVYLPDDILVKVDRMSMAHALEVRNPFLDHRVVEFACRLPLSLKLKGATQKHILRQAFSDLLPPSLLKRHKHGFAVPLGHWFKTSLADSFKQAVLDATATKWIRRDAVLDLWREHSTGRVDHGFKLWSLFVFHRWYHRQYTS